METNTNMVEGMDSLCRFLRYLVCVTSFESLSFVKMNVETKRFVNCKREDDLTYGES